jgi:hypothetical protein
MDCFVAPLLRALDSYASVSIVKQGRRVVAFEGAGLAGRPDQADRFGVLSFHAEEDSGRG